MSNGPPGASLSPSLQERIDVVCDRFEAAWKSAERPRLETYLDECLQPSRLQCLKELLSVELYYLNRAGEAPSRHEYASRYPDAESLIASLWSDAAAPGLAALSVAPRSQFAETFAHPATEHKTDEPSPKPVEWTSIAASGRYRVLRPHAEGGLGKVSVALDAELNREVAFKEIKPNWADDPASRGRFLREAEITGGLEHPGVVPVYGLGRDAAGRPFYAMRFIRGEGLDKAIARFHEGDEASRRGGERTLELRKLLGRFVAMCQTMEYAHRRGAIHRDLKPANVLLGDYGETLIVDWGLAKAVQEGGMGGGGEGATRLLPSPPSNRGSSSDDDAETIDGAIVGTPSYMSPEQAAGRVHDLSLATDLYSLGGVLYSLLTGKPPHAGGEVQEILKAARAGSIVPPRRILASIPKPLESICLRAMAREPSARYESARALAEDVERYLADEPVAAHRETPPERIARFTRKHRAWARAGVAALTLVAGVALVAAVLIGVARQETQRQRAQAELQRDAAKRAIENYVHAVQDDEVLAEEGFRGLRQDLLSTALTYYQDFIRSHEHDPSARRELASAVFEVGRISENTLSATEAVKAYSQAAELYSQLVRSAPTDSQAKSGLAKSYHNLGVAQFDLEKHDEAITAFERAIALHDELRREFPGEAGYQLDLSKHFASLAGAELQLGRTDSALQNALRALEIARALGAVEIDRREHRMQTASSLIQVGQVQTTAGDATTARTSYDEAVSILTSLVESDASDARAASLLAESLVALSSAEDGAGRTEAAVATGERAIELCRALIERHPHITRFRRILATACTNLSQLRTETGDHAKAQREITLAVETLTDLTTDRSSQLEDYAHLAHVLAYQGGLLFAQGQVVAALKSYDDARTVAERDSRQSLDLGDYQQIEPFVLGERARCLEALGRLEEALADYQRAEAILDGLAERHPKIAANRGLLAACITNRANLQLAGQDFAAAEAGYSRAIELCSRLIDDEPTMIEYHDTLATAWLNLARVQQGMGRLDLAASTNTKALQAAESVANLAPEVLRFQETVAKAHLNLAFVRLELQELEAAFASVAESVALYRRLVAENPGLADFRSTLGNAYGLSALVEMRRGRFAEAKGYFQEGLEILNALSREYPDHPGYLDVLGDTQNNFGALLEETGQSEEAVAQFDQSILVRRRLLELEPAMADVRFELAVCLGGRAGPLLRLGREDEAIAALNEAILAIDALVAAHPQVPQYASGLAAYLVNLGIIEVGRERVPFALERFERAVAAWSTVPPQLHDRGQLELVMTELSRLEMSRQASNDAELRARAASIRANLTAMLGVNQDSSTRP